MLMLQLSLTFSELRHEYFILSYYIYYNDVLLCSWCLCAIAKASHFGRYLSQHRQHQSLLYDTWTLPLSSILPSSMLQCLSEVYIYIYHEQNRPNISCLKSHTSWYISTENLLWERVQLEPREIVFMKSQHQPRVITKQCIFERKPSKNLRSLNK